MVGLTFAKIENIGKTGQIERIGEELGALSKIGNVRKEVFVVKNAIVKKYDVIHVTREGVAFLPSSKYQILHIMLRIHRPGSYGEYLNGKFVERLRIDPATPQGMKGPNYSHYHRNRSPMHYRPYPKNNDPGFKP